MTSATIGKGVTIIEAYVFQDCKSLKTIHLTIKKVDEIILKPMALWGLGFNIIKEWTIFVPSGTRWVYRHHPVFGKFKNIEIEPKKKK